MRTLQRIFCALPLVGASVIGCNSGTVEQVGAGQVRVVLDAQRGGPISMRLTAAYTADAVVALDRSVDLQPEVASMFEGPLDQASYTLQVEAYALGDTTRMIGSGNALAIVEAGETTEVKLTVGVARGANSLGILVAMAPQIEGIVVTPATDPSSVGATGSALLDVRAVDPAGGSLAFFWSGLGLDRAVQGSSTLAIPAAAAAASLGAPTVHLVVQNAAGVTTAADIVFTGNATCAICGTAATTEGPAVETSAPAQACLALSAQCGASCDARLVAAPTATAAQVQCYQRCGLDLAACNAT